MRKQHIVHFSTFNGVHFELIIVESASASVVAVHSNQTSCFACTKSTFCLHIVQQLASTSARKTPQNTRKQPLNAFILLFLTKNFQGKAFSTMISAKCTPFEVEKWTMCCFLTIFSRYFESFFCFVLFNYVY